MKPDQREPEFDRFPESMPVSIGEARRMVFVYRHLVKLEQELFDTLARMIPTMPHEAQREAEQANLPLISSHVTRFRERLDYWIERERELEADQTGKKPA